MPERARAAIGLILVTGAVLQVWLLSHQVFFGDQRALLAAGRAVVEEGTLPAHAKRMSGRGKIPGALLPIVVALPLTVWDDDRAPALLMALTQWAAIALLAMLMGRRVGPVAAAVYLAVYVWSPWRIYHSGFLWEPGYVLLPAALHFWLCDRLQRRPGRLASAGLAALLVLAIQIHASGLVLWIATAWLIGRRHLRLHAPAAAAGALIGALTLLPTAAAWLEGELPAILPSGEATASAPLVAAGNGLRSSAYWVRLGSADVGRRLRQATRPAPADPEEVLRSRPGPVARRIIEGISMLALASVALALLASWRYFKPSASGSHPSPPSSLRDYAFACLIGTVVASVLSPITIQGWHLLIVLHAACLPTAWWIHRAFRGDSRGLHAVAVAFLVVEVAASLSVAIAHPMYRG